jgi:hypothetical protein
MMEAREQLREAERAAEEQTERARLALAQAVKRAHEAGLSYAQAGRLLGVSRQRAQRIAQGRSRPR